MKHFRFWKIRVKPNFAYKYMYLYLRLYGKLQKLLDDDITADKMVGLGEDFYIELYRKIATEATTLDQIRVIMYNLPKYIHLREYQQQAVYSIFTCFVFICKSADGNIWKKCWMQKTTGFTRT